MKPEEKPRKHKRVAAAPSRKGCCGTLSYLAECRRSHVRIKTDERQMLRVGGETGIVRKLQG